MSLDWFKYKTDKDKYYAVQLDEALGDKSDFGFEDVVSDIETLPRGIRMRAIQAVASSDALLSVPKYRRFVVGSPDAPIIRSYGLSFSYKGVIYKVTKFTPERRRKVWQPPLQT